MQINMPYHADTRHEAMTMEKISIRKIQQDEEENKKK
jgi:hypothetical protein